MKALAFFKPLKQHSILLTLVFGVVFLIWITLTGVLEFSGNSDTTVWQSRPQVEVQETQYTKVVEMQEARTGTIQQSTFKNPFLLR